MSRERKVNVHCFHCNKTGIKYITEEYRNGPGTYSNGSWQCVSSALSEGWSRYNGGYILCPKCVHDPKAWREINAHRKSEQASRKRQIKKKILCVLTLLSTLGVAALILRFMESDAGKYATWTTALGVLVSAFIVDVKKGVGCSILLVLVVGLCVYCNVGNKTSQTVNDPENNEVAQKPSTYLSGVDDITTTGELGDFYFSIANKFYYNEMGLKGTQEQIDAGNKLMVRVYDFLGISAKREMLDIDSMKVFIKNFAGVSDFRKEKALEDLQTGIRKIESLDE